MWTRARVGVLVLAALAAAPELRAEPRQDPAPEVLDDRVPVNVPMIVVEELAVFLPPTIWYWNTKEHQAIDWELDWNWHSWKQKLLTFEKVSFDTNPFAVNAIRHPLKGVVDYHIARTNGVGMLGSTVFALLMGAAWEYFIEYREQPSINDMLLNTAGGLGLGEPLWQLGQLWRGGALTASDRARTAVFSPFDALHDSVRSPHRWHRPRAWRTFVFEGGLASRDPGETSRLELDLRADLELVAEPTYLEPGPNAAWLRPGAWSRIQASAAFGDVEVPQQRTSTRLDSRTTLVGHHARDAQGNGRMVALASGFVFRKDWLADEWDKLCLAHLLGGQLQLSHRGPGLELRLDAAAFGDFALVQALVFGPDKPFPDGPPFHTPLQAFGYYDAAGVSGIARLRAATPRWTLDAEASVHRWWQIDARARDPVDDVLALQAIPLTPTDVVDTRVFGRGALGYQLGARWGIAATVDGAVRWSTWSTRTRRLDDLAGGLRLQVEL